jgi:hypothetical protein
MGQTELSELVDAERGCAVNLLCCDNVAILEPIGTCRCADRWWARFEENNVLHCDRARVSLERIVGVASAGSQGSCLMMRGIGVGGGEGSKYFAILAEVLLARTAETTKSSFCRVAARAPNLA